MNYTQCMLCGAQTVDFYVCDNCSDHETQPTPEEISNWEEQENQGEEI